MRHTVVHAHAHPALSIPRGWIILGLAACSWMLVLGGWSLLSEIFTLVAAA